MVWESGGGEHFDAAFIDIFARKSNTRVRQCSKENLTINLRAFQAQKSVYCTTERVRFIFMLFMRPNAGKPRLVMEKFMYVGQKSKISSSLIDQIAAVLSVLNSIYILFLRIYMQRREFCTKTNSRCHLQDLLFYFACNAGRKRYFYQIHIRDDLEPIYASFPNLAAIHTF